MNDLKKIESKVVYHPRTKAGPGNWPFGHHLNDDRMYEGKQTHHAMYIPNSYFQGEKPTTHRYKVTIGMKEHSHRLAYFILPDVLRAFMRYRLHRAPESESDTAFLNPEGGPAALRAASGRKRDRKVSIRRVRPAQCHSSNTAVCTVLHIPRGSADRDTEDTDMQIVLSCDPDSDDEKEPRSEALPSSLNGSYFLPSALSGSNARSSSSALDGSYSLPSSLGSSSSSLDALPSSFALPEVESTDGSTMSCSTILGDSQKGADASCAKYMSATFIGRMFEAVTLNEHAGSDDAEFMALDKFCHELVKENKRLYDLDYVRESKVNYALGRANNGAYNATTRISSYAELFQTDIEPCELLLDEDMAFRLMTAIDAIDRTNMDSKAKKTAFSTFFSLKKQLNLLQNEDVDNAFKQYETYVKDSRLDLVGFPALRKRYTKDELIWADMQARALPIPAEVWSMDDSECTKDEQMYLRRIPSEFTPEELEASLHVDRALELDPRDARDNLDIHREADYRARKARAQVVAVTGLGQSADVIDERYLHLRNTDKITKIRDRHKQLMDTYKKTGDNPRVIRKMNRAFRRELSEYKRFAAVEVANTIWNEHSEASETLRQMAMNLDACLTACHGQVDFSFPKLSTNMTWYGDFWALFVLVQDLVFDVCHTHDVVSMLFMSALDSTDPYEGLHPNIIQDGEAEGGKSRNYGVVSSFLMSGLLDAVSSATKNAFKDDRSRDGLVEVHEEANDAWFGVSNGRGGTNTEEEQQMKAKLTSNCVVSHHGWIDKESGKRMSIRTYHSCKGVFWINTNQTSKYSKAGLSRFIVINVSRKNREGHNISDMVALTEGEDIRNIKRQLQTTFTYLNCLVGATFTLIKCGVLDQVETPVFEAIWSKAKRKLDLLGIPFAVVPGRQIEMAKGMVRAMTIVRALMIRFSPHSVYYKDRTSVFDVPSLMQALVTLEPDLVDADPSIAVHILGYLPLLDRNRFSIIEAITHIYFKTTPWCVNPYSSGIQPLLFEARGIIATEKAREKGKKRREICPSDDLVDLEERRVLASIRAPVEGKRYPADRVRDANREESDTAVRGSRERSREERNDERDRNDPAVRDNRERGRDTEARVVSRNGSTTRDAERKERPEESKGPERPEALIRSEGNPFDFLKKRFQYPAFEPRHPRTCRCAPCLECRLDRIVVRTQEIAFCAQMTDMKFEDQERRVRALQHENNKEMRQLRYLELYDVVADVVGDNCMEIAIDRMATSGQADAQENSSPAATVLMQDRRELRYSASQADYLNNPLLTVPEGVYFMAKDPFNSNRDPAANGAKPSVKSIISKISQATYAFLSSNQRAVPSITHIKAQVTSLLTRDEVRGYDVTYPEEMDSGLGVDRSKQRASKISILKISDYGDLMIAGNAVLTNPVDPMRHVIQSVLEYKHSVPRSYPYGTSSDELPYIHSVINVLPDATKDFDLENPHEYSADCKIVTQVGLTGFRDIPSQRPGSRRPIDDEDESKHRPTKRRRMDIGQALPQAVNHALDMPIEDFAWLRHYAKHKYTPEMMEILGSAPTAALDRRIISMQNDHQKTVGADNMHPEAETMRQFKLGPYPNTLISSINEMRMEKERHLRGEVTRTSSISSAKLLQQEYPHSDIDSVLAHYQKTVSATQFRPTPRRTGIRSLPREPRRPIPDPLSRHRVPVPTGHRMRVQRELLL